MNNVRTGSSRAGAVLVVAGLLLAGCTSTPDPKTYVGKTMDVAYRDLGSPNVIDLTTPVTGQSTDPDAPPPPTGWLIVAACARDESQHQYVDLGIIPKSLATPQIRAEAKNGTFDKYVYSCPAATPSSQ
jgi:hypothetical protein